MMITLETFADVLNKPILTENPFPDSITSWNASTLARFAEWAEAAHAKIQADLKRLGIRASEQPAEDWELAALSHACDQWRVFETFRLLHERGWCPALLFRLSTKKDLLVLCDAEADSSKDGFGDRQKRALAKRGIDNRFRWVAARQMVAALGLLDSSPLPSTPGGDGEWRPGAPSEHVEAVHTSPTPPGVPVPQAVTADEDNGVFAVGGAPEQNGSVEHAGSAEGAADGPTRDEEFPSLQLDRVWSALPSYTKARLEAVYQRMACGLWTQFADRFYASFKKAEMLTYVQRLVRFHANLEAVQHLTDQQLDALLDWMRSHLDDRYQRDDDLRLAARLFQDLLAMADLELLSPEAWNMYRDAELRRIGAFCYHRFYEQRVGAEQILA